MKKSIFSLGKALNQDQLKQISGGQEAPTSCPLDPWAWEDDCENHNHFYDYNTGRGYCVVTE
ncbi:hypothetical protein [Tenacibaculum caenipelagi]|uniref:Uncharacterized protein n=1 Tax=Tenacibaculum caenipelagi TaxID=1325435 RepID=A0A4R6TKQ5_9FLAO|nr:hypothetical protein [Tenacibaculum caenipelagi]TDQ29974.1 hypothetical protein DFQ07_0308 [Tenacibaculum caenipelagi]